ncbi:MAG: ribosome maturation factor RimP [Deltaproteobacteria bacterium RIFOXYC2_FULL_48_10]|nr:MAG: ribosome maturation factor RimP [Deltaproteobacteria bacterium RIFOXYC2_FULL_48_10]OGR31762.1 MAG: ribosome maturation factor RimP [Desulfobacula sp. RIFOXYB2_FULL_45_6]
MDVGPKKSNFLVERIREMAEPLCQAENFELVHVEVVSFNREKIVRFFLDKPGGITLEDCVYASRQLGDLIDVYIENIGKYRLEVSSPGPNRPLKKKEDFLRFKGERVKIETAELIENKKKFTGILEIINDDSVVIAVDGKKVEIKDHEISKAILAGQ